MLVSVNVRLLNHLQYFLVAEVKPNTVEHELYFRGRNISVAVLTLHCHFITHHDISDFSNFKKCCIESHLVKDSEDLLEVVNSFLLCLSLDHELHKLSEIHGAGAVSVSVVNQLLQLLLGGIVAEGPHHRPQLLGGHRAVSVLLGQHILIPGAAHWPRLIKHEESLLVFLDLLVRHLH